jgi:hypothetical protein
VSVDAHAVHGWVDDGSKGADLAVDHDPAVGDELVRTAP